MHLRFAALGIDTSDYSFPYVASWASGKELKELKDSMDTIRLTAADFLEKLGKWCGGRKECGAHDGDGIC